VRGRRSITLEALVVLLLACLTGCSSMFSTRTSSSLVDFLYPAGEKTAAVAPALPHLELPLRVGIAFVPTTRAGPEDLSDVRKEELLKKTREAFLDRDFISAIEVIPSTYMRPGGGFEAIEQVARLYGLDVVALVSYDQVAVSDDTKASILYWTIVGAYLIPASRHDVHTLVDTAVFDVATRTLLFRAPGTSTLKETSTLVDSPRELRESRDTSFAAAMADMTGNLAKELDVFKGRVQQEGVATVAQRDGAGALDLSLLGLLLTAFAFATAPRPGRPGSRS
jgi:rhombotail lipoprotein